MDPADLDLASLAFLAGVMLLGAAVTLRQRDTVFGLTLVWGLVGTYEGTSDESAMLQWASLAAVALMVVLCALSGGGRVWAGGGRACLCGRKDDPACRACLVVGVRRWAHLCSMPPQAHS